jgi:steroid delta-isomerase-like uncharacterized protein
MPPPVRTSHVSSLAEQRLAAVLEHMRLENEHRFDGCIAVFEHPRYELMPTGEVHDGGAGVGALLRENLTAFPDFRYEPRRTVPAEDVVFTEGHFVGTHHGPWRGLPATGRVVRVPMAVVFEFQGTALVCERVYFDLHTVLRQLGVARDPQSLAGRVTTLLNHPWTVLRAMLRALLRRRP